MARIAINLLPAEFIQEEIKRARFYKIQALGVVVILLMVFLASLVVALRILQSQNIQQVEAKLSQEEKKVMDLKDRQASLIILKNRLATINQYLGVSSRQVAMYSLVEKLVASSITISSFSIDKSGAAMVVAATSDTNALDDLITKLTDEEFNDNKISEVAIENLSRGKDGIYRISFKVKAK